MIIFLFGPDDYRRLRKKQGIIAEFKKKRSELGLGVFDLTEKNELEGLESFLKSQSMFESSKLAVIDNAFEADEKKLAALLKPFADVKGIQLLISEKTKPVKALAFLVAPPSLSEKFEHLAGADLVAFAKTEAKRMDVTLAPSAAQFLASVYAGNPWGLVTELQKLSGLKSTIEKSDLDALDLEAAPNYWGLFMGLKSADGRTRLAALETLFALNDPAPKIFNMLASQAGEKTPRMAEYDLAIKSGKLDYPEALLDLVLTS